MKLMTMIDQRCMNERGQIKVESKVMNKGYFSHKTYSTLVNVQIIHKMVYSSQKRNEFVSQFIIKR